MSNGLTSPSSPHELRPGELERTLQPSVTAAVALGKRPPHRTQKKRKEQYEGCRQKSQAFAMLCGLPGMNEVLVKGNESGRNFTKL